MTLQELLESVAADLDPAVDYRAQLCSGGYRTPNGIKQADNAEQIQRACGLLLGDANIIWKAAGGVADPDLIARIADLEEQRQLDDGLARKLYDNVFRYSESKISNSTNRKLKGRLKAAYGKTVQGKLVCMLTSEALPSKTVIAAHLYKSSWAVFVELALGFSDIDDVRNGLLLWKPIEHAFDTAQMCFTYDTQHNSFVARVLNPALLTEKLSSYGQRVMGARWAAPSSARAMTLTFADIDNVALSFPLGCEVRPYKRVLCYQAHLAQREAAKQGWIQINFDDFWSEDEPYVAKVQRWLSKQRANGYGE
ncbi:TPA: hypothetical protein ACH3X1_014292 [Trebouxia sp. C0004]